jgi:zinc transporter ZupT
VVGLVLLAAGRFVQFDDTSGFGSDQWIFPLGLLAPVPAIAAVVVAWRHPKARVWLGIALAVLAGFLVWQMTANSGFRFIWSRDEGELAQLTIALGLVAALLVATGVQKRWLIRAAVYLCGCAVLVLIAVVAGTAYYDATDCESQDSDCLSLLGGMVWGVVSLPIAAVAIVVIEVVLWRRRNRQPQG